MAGLPDMRLHLILCDRMEAQGSLAQEVAHIRGGILGRAARLSKSIGTA
jgi:hypothetical protein